MTICKAFQIIFEVSGYNCHFPFAILQLQFVKPVRLVLKRYHLPDLTGDPKPKPIKVSNLNKSQPFRT